MGGEQSRLTLSVLPYGHASQRLADAEAADFYMARCNESKSNLTARRGHIYAAYNYDADYRLKLHHSLEASTIPSILLRDLGHTEIAVLYPSADGGMPHTRPQNIICIPYSHTPPSHTTIMHELWHIHQRRYPAKWESALNAALGYRPWPAATLPDELERQRRYNPDTITTPFWIWRDTWVPVPVFQNITAQTLTNTRTWFYNVKTGRISHEIPPEMLLRELPASAATYEHPYETAAYILSEPATRNSALASRLIELLGK
jgi:hypothetical protein